MMRAIILFALAALPLSAVAEEATLSAGYDFSDEKGGFRITHVSGLGTRSDPVILRAVVETEQPTTIVIRATRPINPFAHPRTHSTGTLHFAIETENASGQPWVAAEFELQEIWREPSVYGDGLSFDQRRVGASVFSASAFAEHRLDFEPYDRLLFRDGVIDPRASGQFSLLVTDLTPAAEFFLQFDPQVPAM
ncbi:MAG: hypothetical protein AAFP99_02885 [Pseudomonadota bacterium]